MGLRGSVAEVRQAFPAPAAEPARGALPPGMSAVLVPVFEGEDGEAVLLFTKRAETLRRHAGELSFPGGRVDATDAHPMAAALREAEEEVGLVPDDVEVLGHLTDMTTYYNVLVASYVGVARGEPPREARSRDEVAELLAVPVSWLLDERRYESRAHVDLPERRVHYWDVGGSVLWGITGEITARLLSRVWGWEPPGEPRVIREVSEFRPARW